MLTWLPSIARRKRTPRGIFLKRGDVVRITVDGIGTLTNTMA